MSFLSEIPFGTNEVQLQIGDAVFLLSNHPFEKEKKSPREVIQRIESPKSSPIEGKEGHLWKLGFLFENWKVKLTSLLSRCYSDLRSQDTLC
jgi:hypothetical protein